MTDDTIPEMIDLIFDLDGGIIPAAYPFALWDELTRHVPQLAAEQSVGVFPLRATENSQGMLLPRRAKLALRLPTALVEHTAALSGRQLDISGSILKLGAVKTRAIQPSPTIHAQMVASASDEVSFMSGIATLLGEMGIAGKLICGKRRTINGDQQSIHGYSLVVHELKPEASLQLQYAGLGEARRFGCGIFVPYKVISGLSDN